MGWITSTRTLTTSPALTLDGTLILTLPISAIALAPAPADGDLDLLLGHQQSPVAQLGDGAHAGGLSHPQAPPAEGRAHAGPQREIGREGAPVVGAHDADRPHA